MSSSVQTEPLPSGLKTDTRAKMDDHNTGSRKEGIASGEIPSYSGVNKSTAAQGVYYSPTSYDYQYPGHNGTYNQMDGAGQMSSSGGAYPDNNGSLLYYMPSYNPYATGTFVGVDGQQPYFSSSDAMPACYSWNSSKSATSSNGTKSNDFNSKRTVNPYSGNSPNYPLDNKSQQHFTSTVSKSILQSKHIRSLNKLASAYQSTGDVSKGYQPPGNFSSFAYQNQALYSNYAMNYASSGGRIWNEHDKYKSREKSYTNGESEELTRGPRGKTTTMPLEDEKVRMSLVREKYNVEGFQAKYDRAKFYVIKSYSEDDVHKCIKYDVWSSTPNGNKKLDTAFRDADGKTKIFLLFSVNGSGQFVGVAEMIGPVDYEKNMDFWQLDKWNGFFPVKWHIVKDVPNTLLRHIILENNDNRPVTYTRDTQEVGSKQGSEMLEIFKSYSAKTSLLDDLSFYENRDKLLKARRINNSAFQAVKSPKAGELIVEERSMTNGLKDPTSSLINLTRNLSINPTTSKANCGDKSGS